MKRLLSALLTVCLVCTMLFVPTSAAVDDHTPPVVTGFYMSNPGATLTAGDTINIAIAIEDESNLRDVSVNFHYICADGYWHAVAGYATDEELSKSTGFVNIQITIPGDCVNGTYRLAIVSSHDISENSVYYLKEAYLGRPVNPGCIDFDSFYFTVTGCKETDDHTPPKVTFVSMDEPGAIVTAGDVLHFSIGIEDESNQNCGGLTFIYKCSDGVDHYLSATFGYGNDGIDHVGTLTFDLEINENDINGTYIFTEVYVSDSEGNYEHYPPESLNSNPGNIDFDSFYFTVTGCNGIDDHTPPTLTSVSMDEPGRIVKSGDAIQLYIQTEDASGIDGADISFYYICDLGHTHQVYDDTSFNNYFYDKDSKTLKMKIRISDNAVGGTYTLGRVRVHDICQNSVEYLTMDPFFGGSPNPGSIDFESNYFTVASSEVAPSSVSIPASITVAERDVYTIRPDVIPIGSLPQWTWESEDQSICTVTSAEQGTKFLVTGISPGTTTITGTTQNGLVATSTVTVISAPLPESGSISESYHVATGDYIDIKPNLIPSDATTMFEVSSDNPHVASADLINGGTAIRIFGNNAGNTTITIRGANGLLLTTTVTVGSPTDRQHEKIILAGTAATCTKTGSMGGAICSACDYIFEEPEILPMLPHSFSDWVIIREATYYTDGLRGHTCTVCGRYEEESYSLSSVPSQSISPEPDPTTAPSPTPSVEPTPVPTATPEPEKTQVNVGDQSIDVTVDKDSATVTVPEQELAEAIDAAAEKGVLEVDVSNLEDVSEVTLSQNIADAVSKSEDVTGLKLKTANGDITLDGNALQTVADTVTGEHDEVKLSVKTIDPNDIPDSQKYPIAPVLNRAVFIELSADVIHKDASGKVTGTDAIHEFNGEVTVSVPYEQPENMKGRQVIACYIADDGSITYFNVVYKDGIATFTTRHFSTFAIIESYAAVFEDVDISKWYMTSIEYALAHELMAGESETIFAPDGMVSRAMAVQLLYNLSGQPETDVSATFADVDDGKWYAPAIAWAENKKVAAGYGNDQFGPEDLVTREQLATMLWQYAGRPETTGSIDSYEDAADVSSWAKEALCWAVENGIMQGSANHLNPKATATRAEAAALMANLHQMQNQNEST